MPSTRIEADGGKMITWFIKNTLNKAKLGGLRKVHTGMYLPSRQRPPEGHSQPAGPYSVQTDDPRQSGKSFADPKRLSTPSGFQPIRFLR